MILREITDHGDSDKIQHDRVDYFMRAKARFQDARDCAPNATGDHSREKTERYKYEGRALRESNSHPSRGKGRDVKLTLSTDIEQAAAKSNQYRKAGEN